MVNIFINSSERFYTTVFKLPAVFITALCSIFYGCSSDVKPAQLINGFNPVSGKPGATVLIEGINFVSSVDSKVAFMGIDAKIINVTDTQLTVLVPDEALTGTVSVTMNGKTIKSSSSFIVIPTVISFSPLCGPIASEVTINGTNFDSNSNNTTVIFSQQTGAITATATVKAISSKQIAFTVPPGLSGTFATRLLINNSLDSDFYPPFYITPYTVTGFSPISGSVGTVITITGTGFNLDKSNDYVSFSGAGNTSIAVQATEVTSTQLKAVVPSGAVSGIIAVKVNQSNAPYIIFPTKFSVQ